MIIPFQEYSASNLVSTISMLIVYLQGVLLKSPSWVIQRTGLVILLRFFCLPLMSHSLVEFGNFLLVADFRHGNCSFIGFNTVWCHFQHLQFVRLVYLIPWLFMNSINVVGF